MYTVMIERLEESDLVWFVSTFGLVDKREEVISDIENCGLVAFIKTLESTDIASPTMLLHLIALYAAKHDYPIARMGLRYNTTDRDGYPTFSITILDQPIGIVITEVDNLYSATDGYINIRSFRPMVDIQQGD